ncbi:MAG: hypothetical protein Q8918_11005 [Bacteroidota bacterium]|nr:hypothetical protein [Bacteroidota bacterium]MDP4213641.1 hypothetical protein [Bacteroidota bacterium]MDP4250625.1 hypothetical protein [Bacteroidota bacterium]
MHIAWFQYFQIACLLVALYCYRGLRACSLLAFIPLLIIVNITEFAGINFHFSGRAGNYSVYNLYLLVSTPFYFYLAGKMLFLTSKERVVFYTICILCLILVYANFFFIQGMSRFDTYSLVLIEIMTIVFSSLSLVRLTILDQNELDFMREPFFWINSAYLLFGLITLVVLGLQEYILLNQIEIAHKTLYYVIMPTLNAVVYSGYSYAFILCRTQKTR